MSRRFPFLPVAVALLACSGAGDDEAAGVPFLTAVEEVRIGSVDDPDVGFSRIGGVAVAPDGRVYVAESQDAQIRVYDRDGNRLGAFGTKGEGPGEFASPGWIGLFGDTVWVSDQSLNRITFFDADGHLLGVWSPRQHMDLGTGGAPVMYRVGRLLPDRRILTTYGVAMMRGGALPDSVAIPILVIDSAGEPVDTVRTQRMSLAGGSTITVAGEEFPVPRAQQTIDLTLDAPDGSHIVVQRPVAMTSPAHFRILRIAGVDTLFDREFAYAPVPYDAALADDVAAESARRYARFAGQDESALRNAMRAAIAIPTYHAPVSHARPGEDDSIWLRLEETADSLLTWLVLGGDGTPRARTRLPARATIYWTGGDEIWAAVPDDLDVPWLVRYRLTPAPE